MDPDKSSFHNKLYYILVLLISFALPLSKKLIPLLIILLVLNWVVEGKFVEKLKRIRHLPYVGLFVAFYLMHLIGLLYSDNIEFGMFDVEIKLSLLVFPLLFSTSKQFHLNQVLNVFTSFVLGCSTAVLICLGRSAYMYSKTGDINSFLYGELSMFHHPTYFAMYICLALSVMFYCVFRQREGLTKYHKVAMGVLIPVFSVFVILLNAKIGLISLMLILVIAFLYLLLVQKKYLKGLMLLIGALLVVGSLNWIAPLTFQRMQWAISVILGEVEPAATESTFGRMKVWPVAGEIIQENPIFGVGTGDIKDELINKYDTRNLSGMSAEKLNAHNQFLQSFAALGAVGFLLLIGGILAPLVQSIGRKKYVYLFFLLIIALNSLTESILEVQAGVIFYAFFNSFFMFLDTE